MSRISAPDEWKIKKVQTMHGLSSEKEARAMLKKVSKEREAFVKKYFKTDLSDPVLYDLIINNAAFEREDMVELMLTGMRRKKLIK